MTSRRHLLIVSPWLGLPLAGRAAEPADLVQVQPGTLPIILTAPHGGRMAAPGVGPRVVPERPPGDTSYVTTYDPETDRIALGIAARIKALTQRDAYLVVARFDLYGSPRANGIDAVQFEFGADYRRKATLDRTIEGAARAIVAFRDVYLT